LQGTAAALDDVVVEPYKFIAATALTDGNAETPQRRFRENAAKSAANAQRGINAVVKPEQRVVQIANVFVGVLCFAAFVASVSAFPRASLFRGRRQIFE
jgi:hypothetical protein